jgi:sialidase-1
MTALTSPMRFAAGATMFVLAASVVVRAAERPVATDVFVSGSEGYHTFRIPSLIASAEGTLLAFCEGRKSSRSDHGDIDLVLRRSSDGGKTWGPIILVYEEGGPDAVTIGNPCPVVDASTGTIWLPFCRDNDTVLVTSSSDDGRRWSAPQEITQQVKRPDWGWYATGPGVGIQLRRGEHAGRLVIPCDHRETVEGDEVMFSHVFYSDDNGQSWKLGGSVDRHTDECQVVELSGGDLLINMRNYWERTGKRPERGGKRAVARSSDGGVTWSGLDFDAALIEPICQASIRRARWPATGRSGVILFANPASAAGRKRMTVRASFDDGKTWPVAKQLYAGSSAYCCLCMIAPDQVGCLYEKDDYQRIVLARFPLAWLTSAR